MYKFTPKQNAFFNWVICQYGYVFQSDEKEIGLTMVYGYTRKPGMQIADFADLTAGQMQVVAGLAFQTISDAPLSCGELPPVGYVVERFDYVLKACPSAPVKRALHNMLSPYRTPE